MFLSEEQTIVFLYVVSSWSMRVLNTEQVYSTVSFLAVLVGGDCSAELSVSIHWGGLSLQDLSSAHCS